MTHEQLELGQALRDSGIARADLAQPDAWKHAVDTTIESLARTGRAFTADDVRPLTGESPTGSQGAMGARIRAAACRGVIRQVGYRRSTQPSAHARPLAVWIGVAA